MTHNFLITTYSLHVCANGLRLSTSQKKCVTTFRASFHLVLFIHSNLESFFHKLTLILL